MDIILLFKNKKINYKYMIVVSATLLMCALMILFPSVALLSAKKAISLWANNILPAMFPFFICANFMSYMGVVSYLNTTGYAFCMSVLSGYPMGAKVIGDMRRNNIISREKCYHLISFCSTSGPAFVISALGTSMLGSIKAGTIIAISHFGGAILNGLIFYIILKFMSTIFNISTTNRDDSIHTKNAKNTFIKANKNKKDDKSNYMEVFTDAILASFKSMGIILSYIILFMMLVDILEFVGLFNYLTDNTFSAIAKGVFEITLGCAEVAAVGEPEMIKIIICSVLISFGGFSILGQTMSMLAGTGVKISYVFFTKICHGLIAGAIAWVLLI